MNKIKLSPIEEQLCYRMARLYHKDGADFTFTDIEIGVNSLLKVINKLTASELVRYRETLPPDIRKLYDLYMRSNGIVISEPIECEWEEN